MSKLHNHDVSSWVMVQFRPKTDNKKKLFYQTTSVKTELDVLQGVV